MVQTVLDLRITDLIDRFGGKWDYIQLTPTVDPSTTVRLTFRPPTDFVYLPFGHRFGGVTNFIFRISYSYDNDFTFRNTRVTNSLINANDTPFAILQPVYDQIIFDVENTDTIARQYDAMDYGAVIPIRQFDAFMQEIRKGGYESISILADRLSVMERLLGGEKVVRVPVEQTSPSASGEEKEGVVMQPEKKKEDQVLYLEGSDGLNATSRERLKRKWNVPTFDVKEVFGTQ